jgi:flagellin-like protein
MRDEKGLTPVWGAVLLVAIVILLASVLLVFANGFESEQRTPQVASDERFYSEVDIATGDTTPYLTLEHQGGETIQRENVRAVMTVGGESYDNLPTEGPNTGPVRASEELTYDLSGANICGRPADEFTVRLIHEPSNKPIAEQTVDIRERIEPTVEDNTVSAGVPYTATITIVGLAASSNSGTNIEPDTIGARVVINRDSGTERRALGPNGNDIGTWDGPFEDNIGRPAGEPGIQYTTERLSADTSVTLEMRTDKPSYWEYSYPGAETVTRDGTTYQVGKPDGSGVSDLAEERFWVDSGNPDEGNLILLQDGEEVPAIGLAASHQRSLQEILGAQLNGDTLNLDQNDVVALYELTNPSAQPENAPDPSAGGNPDYNDAVAIIEINAVPGSSTSDPGTLYC